MPNSLAFFSLYFALRDSHLSRGHSWQLKKDVSVGKYIPDTDLAGSINRLSVNLHPDGRLNIAKKFKQRLLLLDGPVRQ